eukprot:TRINITY_DN7040_c0_g1_i1.p1 TRINITY_DN7040_c0_g1~~TRINITY_DN7040_c0_g1_i1.p1  ORF type:complete len:461 (+),score=75.57 TRINITY_DN7040_c0_g1_i1:62-1444(+)
MPAQKKKAAASEGSKRTGSQRKRKRSPDGSQAGSTPADVATVRLTVQRNAGERLEIVPKTGRSGLYVSAVHDGPGKRAGVRVGMLLRRVAGKPVQDKPALVAALGEAGTEFEIVVGVPPDGTPLPGRPKRRREDKKQRAQAAPPAPDPAPAPDLTAAPSELASGAIPLAPAPAPSPPAPAPTPEPSPPAPAPAALPATHQPAQADVEDAGGEVPAAPCGQAASPAAVRDAADADQFSGVCSADILRDFPPQQLPEGWKSETGQAPESDRVDADPNEPAPRPSLDVRPKVPRFDGSVSQGSGIPALVLLKTSTDSLPETVPRFIDLSPDIVTIGRSKKNTVRLDSREYPMMISRKHASVKNSRLLEDLGSTNGFFVNGLKRKACTLNENDVVVFGGGGRLQYGQAVRNAKEIESDCVYRFKTLFRPLESECGPRSAGSSPTADNCARRLELSSEPGSPEAP